MAELCLMASHGPPDLGVVLPKDFHSFLPHQGSNQVLFSSHSFDSNLQQKEDWKFTRGLLDRNNLITLDATFKRTTCIQGSEPSGFGIANKCNSQEKILKLLASGSMGVENGLLDLPMLHELMGHLDFAPFTQQSIIYPTREFYFNELSLNPDGQQQNYFGNEMSDLFNKISGVYSSKNTNKSSMQTMLVPFFERRKRPHTSTITSNLLTEKAGPLKSHGKVRRKVSERKKSSTRTIKEREHSYLHMCEILLSILVNKEQQQTKNNIHSLKKSSPQLPDMLTQCSATIAGAGIAVVLSVLCRVACNRVPFCASKILSTGLGLGLIWLSWAVHKLRDTVVSISKISGRMGGKEEEMVNCLERNMKDICYRVAALMAVAVLRFV
ncbi:hypothetical protein F511_03682 [Dorcoceras hygrometricum]|uniref:Uncharacterized protein n=1 Tax=Dorcoceras hygrometricum TaxID=472368 RepID=A0A2Z7BG38_9LAMI|nr:hypothetical protein F511_03682 [Dorcoceras hygrometricum]